MFLCFLSRLVHSNILTLLTLAHNVPVLWFQRDPLPSLAGVKLISQKSFWCMRAAIVLRGLSGLLEHLHAKSWPPVARLWLPFPLSNFGRPEAEYNTYPGIIILNYLKVIE